MMRRRLLLSCVLSALVATGAACGGGEDPQLVATEQPTATPEPTAAPEPTPEPTATPVPPAPVPPAATELRPSDFTEVYGCGFGFSASNADQTAGIFIEFNDFDAANAGQVPPVGAVPSVIWSGRVELGTDLFADWCNDAIEPGVPQPNVIETWEIVQADISIDGTPPVQSVGSLTASLGGIRIVSPDGDQVVLGDLTLTNDTWGAFAG